MVSTPESAVKKFPCPSCGANLEFNPKSAQLKCPYCAWEDAIPESAEQVQERSYEEYLNKNRTHLAKLSATALEVRCSDCGANVTFEPPHVAGQCPFCAASIVAQPKLADPTLAPEGIVPFTIDRQKARESIQRWIGSRWFAPNALKQLAQQEKIQGVYLPFWTYDSYTTSHYSGERGEYYYITETYTETNDQGETETKTREVRHTRWYFVSGMVSRFFDDVLIPATKLVNIKRLNALEPWHLQESLRPYDPSYLAGFEAQRSQVALKEGFENAKDIMSDEIHSDVQCDIGGDEQRIHNISTAYSAITFKHILLPVWLSCYRYRNKQYQVMVNARTGEVQGDRPYSVWKITSAVVAGIALVGGIFVLFNLNKAKHQPPNNPNPYPAKVRSSSRTLSPAPANSPSVDSLREAVNRATSASTLAQSAQTQEEWEEVVDEWEEAIELMQAVSPSNANYNIAQKKIVEYQNYLNTAQQRADSSSN